MSHYVVNNAFILNKKNNNKKKESLNWNDNTNKEGINLTSSASNFVLRVDRKHC